MKRETRWLATLALLMAGLALAACTAPALGGKAGSNKNAAIVNGKPVPMSAFDKQMDYAKESMTQQGLDPKSAQGQETLNQVSEDILNQLIDYELLRQAAEKEGISVTQEDIDSRAQEIIAQIGGEQAYKDFLKQDKLSETEFKNELVRDQILFDRLLEKITANLPATAEQVHVRHIVLNTEQEAQAVKERLAKGEDFAAVAKALSIDTESKENGGDLGFFPRGATEPRFEDVVFALPAHQINIVTTDFGYHVVEVLEKDPNRAVSAQSMQMFREEAVANYVQDLRTNAVVERLVQTGPTPAP